MFVCVYQCVCVCVNNREREREGGIREIKTKKNRIKCVFVNESD